MKIKESKLFGLYHHREYYKSHTFIRIAIETCTTTTANITKTNIFANVTSNMCEWDCRFYEHGVVRRIAMYVMARRAATYVVQPVVVVQVSVAILMKV